MTEPRAPLSPPPAGVPPYPPAPASPTQPPGIIAEWPERAVDAIDHVITTINDKTIRPLIVAARAVVFGLIIAVTTTVVLVVISISLLRLLDVYVVRGRVWGAYALLGILFTAAGAAAWTRRTERRSGASPR